MHSADVARNTAMIAEGPLCLDCIVRETGVPAPAVARALRAIAKALSITNGDHCAHCLRAAPTYSLAKAA